LHAVDNDNVDNPDQSGSNAKCSGRTATTAESVGGGSTSSINHLTNEFAVLPRH
jgi:hypothetical protein